MTFWNGPDLFLAWNRGCPQWGGEKTQGASVGLTQGGDGLFPHLQVEGDLVIPECHNPGTKCDSRMVRNAQSVTNVGFSLEVPLRDGHSGR